MGHHATIGRSLTPAPRVRVTERNKQSGTQRGTDVTLPGDRRGTLGMASPVFAPDKLADPMAFVSVMARQLGATQVWRFHDVHGGIWAIRTDRGYVRIVKGGMVLLGRERLGYVLPAMATSQRGRDDVLTAIIAGTLSATPVKPDASKRASKGQAKSKHMPSQAHGGICPTCYVAMPELTGVCDYCG